MNATETKCPYCDGDHKWEDCDQVFTPIKGCIFKDAEDGCCHFPDAMTPECHVNACPRLDPRVSKFFHKS